MASAQESGLRENCTSRLSEKPAVEPLAVFAKVEDPFRRSIRGRQGDP
jgi:hypothetical protein